MLLTKGTINKALIHHSISIRIRIMANHTTPIKQLTTLAHRHEVAEVDTVEAL